MKQSTDHRKNKGMIRRKPVTDYMDLPVYGIMSEMIETAMLCGKATSRLMDFDESTLVTHKDMFNH